MTRRSFCTADAARHWAWVGALVLLFGVDSTRAQELIEEAPAELSAASAEPLEEEDEETALRTAFAAAPASSMAEAEIEGALPTPSSRPPSREGNWQPDEAIAGDIELGAPYESALARGSIYAASAEPSATGKESAAEKETAKSDLPQAAPGYVVSSDKAMKATWKNGLEIESANKDFRVHVGGRTQVDAVFLTGSAGAAAALGGARLDDAVAIRRARLRADGTMYEIIDWAVEYDFVNAVNDNIGLQPPDEFTGNVVHVTAPTDLWFDIKQLPFVGAFQIGNFKEPIGMEHLTSSRFLDFIERSFNQDAFTGPFNNGFSPGMAIHNTSENKRMQYAIGLFKNTTNVFAYGVGDGRYAATGRVTCLPWFDELSSGRRLFHVGAAASVRGLDDDRIRVRSRGSLRNGPGTLNPVLADSGTFLGDLQTLLATESALVLGPLLLQAEYIASNVDDARTVAAPNTELGDVWFHGYYVQALYFLTGEHREYEPGRGAFGRVVPHENFFAVRDDTGAVQVGRGAWQVGARYSSLRLSDNGINGGFIQDVTLGLNWFLNPNLKFQWNYVYTDRHAAGDSLSTHGFGMRVAHDF